MNAGRFAAVGVVLFGLPAFLPAQTAIWTGLGTGWQGQITPPNNGTAILYFQDGATNRFVPFSANFSVNGIADLSGDTYTIGLGSGASTPLIFTATGIVNSGIGRLQFDPNINLTSGSSLAMGVSNGTIVVPGQITGALSLGLVGSGSSGAFIFNNTGVGNTYTGGTTVTNAGAGTQAVVTFWNNSPFGTGTVSVFGSSAFVAHGTQTIANNLSLSTTTANDPIAFKSWDAALTLSGTVTLGSNTTIQAQPLQQGINASDQTGTFPLPGPSTRSPIIFTGAIGESVGAHSLTVGGAGVVILKPASGSNTYTGGTTVNGSLIFGNSSAIPTTGTTTVNSNGYVGLGDPAVGGGVFSSFLATKVNQAGSSGAVGVDTLPGSPLLNFSDPISLAGFSNTAIRIGTATSAILSGTITPQGANYQFGNGGGTLFVQSNLPNVSTVSQLQLTDALNTGQVSPLRLVLRGNNTYTGGTLANNGFVIFDGATSVPASGLLTAGGSASANGASYVGMTETTGLSVPAFLAKFDKTNTWGIVGFDTHLGNVTVTYSGVDLTGFNNGVFIGTSSTAVIGGTTTTTADNNLRLTAGNGGTLLMNSNITGSTAVTIGSPSAEWAYSDGRVIMLAATGNTYTGGTTLNNAAPITLVVDGVSPLGTGNLSIAGLGPSAVALEAGTSGYSLSNNIVFQAPAAPGVQLSQFYLTGANALTLTGSVSGLGWINVVNTNATLAGNNAAFTGDIVTFSASLTLNNNLAAGKGVVHMSGSFDTVEFGGAATAPTLYGIDGTNGEIVVPNGTALTFDLSNSANLQTFGGAIDGGDGTSTTASVTVTSTNPVGQDGLHLYGSSNYSGGTTITGYGALGLGSNTAAGTGPVTLSSANGSLGLSMSGVVFTNPLTFTAGRLGGFGTFAPSNLTNITFGTGQIVSPGLRKYTLLPAGKLTFNTNITFANGGVYEWSLQDVTRSDGFSQLVINGNLNLSAAPGTFTLSLTSFDPSGVVGYTPLVIGQAYSLPIAQFTGTLTGSLSAIAIDASNLNPGLLPGTVFTLSSTSNSLLINFTAVPEPSTWALLAAGAGMLGWAARRRRVGRQFRD